MIILLYEREREKQSFLTRSMNSGNPIAPSRWEQVTMEDTKLHKDRRLGVWDRQRAGLEPAVRTPLGREAANTLKQVAEAQKAWVVKGRRRAAALGAVLTVSGKWYF